VCVMVWHGRVQTPQNLKRMARFHSNAARRHRSSGEVAAVPAALAAGKPAEAETGCLLDLSSVTPPGRKDLHQLLLYTMPCAPSRLR
jgi:hypothetical protein